MNGFLLDTSAILTLRDNEAGAARVSELLQNLSFQRSALECVWQRSSVACQKKTLERQFGHSNAGALER